MGGTKPLRAQIADGTAKAEGNTQILEQLGAIMATFTPDFEMIPGTARPAPAKKCNPYEAGVEPILGE